MRKHIKGFRDIENIADGNYVGFMLADGNYVGFISF